MSEVMDFMIEIAREAGSFLRAELNKERRVDYKGDIDLVTEADRRSEEMLISRIRNRYPGHDVLAEESTASARGSAFRWIIDPLDGTTNYAHRYPVFCVSIGLEQEGEVILGVIYNPMMEEMFVTEKGRGASLNGERIRVSGTGELNRSLLATGFPYDIRHNPDNNFNYFKRMALKVQAIRRAGSAALDLAYVAAGRFDGFWELKLKPWDTAAGQLLVTEAGGRVTDLLGVKFNLESPHVLATNGRIHEEMLGLFRTIDPMDRDLIRGH
jgi:myo-inositol-1(or 4)-monophosphatase